MVRKPCDATEKQAEAGVQAVSQLLAALAAGGTGTAASNTGATASGSGSQSASQAVAVASDASVDLVVQFQGCISPQILRLGAEDVQGHCQCLDPFSHFLGRFLSLLTAT